MQAIEELVKGVVLPAGQWGSAAGNLLPAFDRVARFDSEQLTEAFRYLLVTEQRVCVIVPLDEEFETVIERQKLVVTRRLPVGLAVSDRVLGDRSAALWGNDETPGTVNLVELALPAVTGLLIAAAGGKGGVRSEPVRVGVMSVRDTEQELPSRVAMLVELECRGGYLESGLPPGPIF